MADQGGSSRAAEHTGATAARGDIAEVPCPNCGHKRNSRFCAKCGQNDRDYIRALPPVLGDILKETFELDSRIFRTIKPLFLRPGELPSEFSRNRRASYVSPIRLYIFSSLAFFFLLSVTTDFEPPGRQEAADGDRQPIRIEAEIQRERAGATIEVLKSLLPPEQQRKVDEIIRRPGMYLSKSVLYGLATNLSADDFESDWNRYLLARVIDIAEDPKAGLSLVLDNLPFAMFVTLPIYTLLLMLFFRRRGRFFTEHLVFAVIRLLSSSSPYWCSCRTAMPGRARRSPERPSPPRPPPSIRRKATCDRSPSPMTTTGRRPTARHRPVRRPMRYRSIGTRRNESGNPRRRPTTPRRTTADRCWSGSGRCW